jgi:S-adenosylmethionine decarboxylase
LNHQKLYFPELAGVEKLLEVWFVRDESEKTQSLRRIPREALDKLMEAARCEIISVTSNSHIDSYVLSESSMFVSDDRIILKTCGTTRLMNTVGLIIEFARVYGNMPHVANIFYSRKNFERPHLQHEKHRCFDTETGHLDEYFGGRSSFVQKSQTTVCVQTVRRTVWVV